MKSIIIAAALAFGLATPALAQEKPTLTIYTYDAFAADWGPAPKLKEAFEKDCDCVVTFTVADSSIGALRKVQLEGPDTAADIVLGLDTNIMDEARRTGFFAPHGADTSRLALPIEWDSPVFLPFDHSAFAFVHDTERLAKAPASLEELANLPDDVKIVIQDPRSSTPGLGLVLWVKQVYGDRAADWWRRVKPKVLTVTKGWSDAYGLFLKGEADMVLSYTTSPAYHSIAEGKTNYAAAMFEEGHYGQVEVAGIVKFSDEIELARRFMQFLISDTAQDIIPTTNWVYPAVETQAGLPDGFKALPVPTKTMLVPADEVDAVRKQAVEEWLDVMG